MRTHAPMFHNRNGDSYLNTPPRCSMWGRSYQMGLIVPLTQMSPGAVTSNTAPVIRPTNAGPSGALCTMNHWIWAILTHHIILHKSFCLNDLQSWHGAASELRRIRRRDLIDTRIQARGGSGGKSSPSDARLTASGLARSGALSRPCWCKRCDPETATLPATTEATGIPMQPDV